jgi:hypothetical protein
VRTGRANANAEQVEDRDQRGAAFFAKIGIVAFLVAQMRKSKAEPARLAYYPPRKFRPLSLRYRKTLLRHSAYLMNVRIPRGQKIFSGPHEQGPQRDYRFKEKSDENEETHDRFCSGNWPRSVERSHGSKPESEQ